jgi:UDP:flavonoid glycosyltransferase YjiC (YdhE family)
MPEILIAALSPLGHVGPLLTVAQGLVDRGDRVTVLSSADHAGRIRAAGATSHAIPAEADFDMTRFDIDRLFVQSMPHQTRVLGGEDVIVVATTGGGDVSTLKVPAPSNAYVAEYIPHELLLPKVDVMVTNGGYGAVQRALATGVPLVVAGNTEDKPEVAARVAWSGAGINLRTGAPTVGAVRAAVREVLGDGRYLAAARTLETAFARRDGVAEIAALVDEVIGEHSAAVHR